MRGRAVRASAPVRPRLRRGAVALVAAAVLVVLSVVAFHAVLAQNQVRLERLRARLGVAESRYAAARLENGRLSSPARITERAAQLGLVVPNVAAVAVPVAGRVPAREGTSATLAHWPEVKRHLDSPSP